MPNRRIGRTIVAVSLVLIGTGFAAGHEHPGEAAPPESLGKVVFPTSCTPQVQSRFEEGVALLHSFEYDRAKQRFEDIAQANPECAIADWGAAMSIYHPLWNEPTEADLAAGWQLIQKAEQASAKGPREKAWIEAAAAFYRPGAGSVQKRAEQYSQAMQQLHAAYPADDEAAVFYALSLLGAQLPTDTELAYSRKAVQILNEVMTRSPDHPGAAHYLIHACDRPVLAQQGLAAARRYAAIAPASAHAVHMPSHIFARLGLWDEDIASNLAAVEAAERASAGVEYRLHPMDFLEYAYLQTGRDDKARAIAAEALAADQKGFGHGLQKYYYYFQAEFPALLALETRDWKTARALTPSADAEPGFRQLTFWAQAVGAGHLRDVAAAHAAVAALDEDREAYRKSHPDRPMPPVSTRSNEARAWLAFAQRDSASATELLRVAIDYQDKVGKGETELPAREMYADMLLELNRPDEALEQYRLSLKSDPNRFNGLFGAGRAAEALGQPDVAAGFYRQLLTNCEEASQPARAELAHAQQFIAGTLRSREASARP